MGRLLINDDLLINTDHIIQMMRVEDDTVITTTELLPVHAGCPRHRVYKVADPDRVLWNAYNNKSPGLTISYASPAHVGAKE